MLLLVFKLEGFWRLSTFAVVFQFPTAPFSVISVMSTNAKPYIVISGSSLAWINKSMWGPPQHGRNIIGQLALTTAAMA
eukprot:1083904-Amphidinium_carterae.2